MSIDTMCPDPDRVAQLMSGSLPDAEVDAICEHVVTCQSCTTILRTVSHDSAFPHIVSPTLIPWTADPEDLNVIEQLIAEMQALSSHIKPYSGPVSEGELEESHRSRLNEGATEIEPNINLEELARQLLRPPQSAGELGWLGPYRVLGVLGSGGMGVVFEAEDSRLSRRVAVKAMQPSLFRREEHRLRFLREAQAAASLDHDNIVPIHHVGEDCEVPFFVMPLLKGESLESRQRREGRLSVVETVRIGKQIASGIAAAHESGLIHRDIKPANIWLEHRGQPLSRVKILDFGLARAEDDESNLTKTGSIAGTPAFMAPEQARGELADTRSDLFSLGCVLYSMLAGKPPFTGRNSAALLFAVLNHQPDSLHDIEPHVPPKLASLVMRLLEKDPTRRVPRAVDVAEALEVIENEASQQDPLGTGNHSDRLSDQSTSRSAIVVHEKGDSSSTRGDSLWFDGKRLKQHHRMIGVSVAALLMALGVLLSVSGNVKVQAHRGTVALTFDSQAADGAEVSVDERQRLFVKLKPGGDPITLDVGPGTHTLKITKAEFEDFSREFSLGAGDRMQIHVQLKPRNMSVPSDAASRTPANGGQHETPPQSAERLGINADVPFPGLVPHPAPMAGLRRWQMETRAPRGDIFAVAWDPDGHRVACGSPIGNVRIIDVATSNTLSIIPAHTGSVWAMDWSPTEDRIVTVGEDGAVRLFDPQGQLRSQLGSHAGTARSVAFSRDGSWIASGGVDAKVRLWRTTGEPGPILSGHSSQVDGIAWHPSGKKLASASLDGTVRIWNLDGTWSSTGIHGPELKGHLGGVLGLSWSSDGELLASAGVDGTILIWTSEGTKHSVISGHGTTVTAISWGKRGLIATSGEDKTVRLWQSDGSLLTTQKLDVRRINDLEWSRDGSLLSVATDSQGIRILNSSGEWEGAIPLDTTSMRAVSFNHTGELATAGDDGFVAVWNSDGTLNQQLKGHTKTVHSVSWNPDVSRLVTGSWEMSIRVWDVQGNTIATRNGTNPTAWNPVGEEIAWTTKEDVLLAEGDAPPRVLRGHKSQVIRLIWNASGTQLASSDVNGEIRLWNRDGSSAGAFQADPMVLALAWHPLQPLLATGCTGHGKIQLRSLDGKLIKTWNAHIKGVIVLDWSSDGAHLLSSSYDQRAHIWSKDGNYVGTLPGPTAIVCAGVWSSTGHKIATAHIDGTVNLWDGHTFQLISTSVIFKDGNWARFDSKGLSHASDPTAVDSRFVVVTEGDSGNIELMNFSKFREQPVSRP